MITEKILFIETTLRADQIVEIHFGLNDRFDDLDSYILSTLTKNFARKCVQKCLVLKFLEIIPYKPYDDFLFPISDNENLFVTIKVCCKALVELVLPYEPYLAMVKSIQGENEAYGNIIMLEIRFHSNVKTVIPISKHIKYANLLEPGQYVFIYGRDIKTKNLNASLTFVDVALFNIVAFDRKVYKVVPDDQPKDQSNKQTKDKSKDQTKESELDEFKPDNLENINSMFGLVFDFDTFQKEVYSKTKKTIEAKNIELNRAYGIDHSGIKSHLTVTEEKDSENTIKIQKTEFIELLKLWRTIRFELAKNFFLFKNNINQRSNPISLIKHMNKMEVLSMKEKQKQTDKK